MRRSRRGGHSGMEFGGSGEDSFVAVVVTKLTGALLFILLLTMVIMALLPRAIDLPSSAEIPSVDQVTLPLAIATPAELPEAIAGRPYVVALAATGGRGPVRWSVDGQLPEGLELEPETGLLRGVPSKGTPEPVSLVLRASDASDRTASPTRLVVYQPDRPLTIPSKWKPALPPIPWREWFDQGFGFLVLALIHMVGMGALGSLERRALADLDPEDAATTRRRFFLYRGVLRLATLGSAVALGLWLTKVIA
jgi:Putative Ig domain